VPQGIGGHLIKNDKQVIIAPASKKQEMYINATDVDVVIFGGG